MNGESLLKRAVPAVVLALVGAVALAGCTVPSHGIVGITRDDDGGLEALIAMCEGHVDAVIVYDFGSDTEKTIGTWDLADPVTDTATLALPGLEAVLKDNVDYASYAGSDDNSSSADGPDFKKSQIDSLTSADVLALSFTADEPSTQVLTLEGWQASVDTYCG